MTDTLTLAIAAREAVRDAVERQRPGMKVAFMPDEPTLHFAMFAAREPDQVADEVVYYAFKVEPHAPVEALINEADSGVREWLRAYDEHKEMA